jgi:hypothetical protein
MGSVHQILKAVKYKENGILNGGNERSRCLKSSSYVAPNGASGSTNWKWWRAVKPVADSGVATLFWAQRYGHSAGAVGTGCCSRAKWEKTEHKTSSEELNCRLEKKAIL